MADLPISLLPALGAPLENNAEFAVAQDGVTYRISAAALGASIGGGGGGAAPVLADGVTIQGNGVSVPLSVINPLPAAGSNGQVLTIIGGNAVWATPPAPLALTVQTNSTLTGNGTPGNVLGVAYPMPNPAGNPDGYVLTVQGGVALWDTAAAGTLPPLGSEGQILQVVGGAAAWADVPDIGAVQTQGIITGNGTVGSPVALNLSGAAPSGSVLASNGTLVAWQPFSSVGDNWGGQTVARDATLTGNGTPGNLLGVACPMPNPAGNLDGYVLTVQGGVALWQTAPSGGLSVVSTDATLTGDGTPGNLLGVVGQVLPTGSDMQTLRHNGTQWVVNSAIKSGVANVAMGSAAVSTDYLLNMAQATAPCAKALTTVTSDGSADRYGMIVEITGQNTLKNNVAGWFVAANQATIGGEFALRIQDGSEQPGFVLHCVDSGGNARWTNPLTLSMPAGILDQTLRHNGTQWVANSLLLLGSQTARLGSGPLLGQTLLSVYADAAGVHTALDANCKMPESANPADVVVGVSGKSSISRLGTNVAGYFYADNQTNTSGKYALWLDDGRQATNKVWKCVNSYGWGIWDTAANALTGGTAPTITGSKGGNAALGNLLTALAALGIITDSTT